MKSVNLTLLIILALSVSTSATDGNILDTRIARYGTLSTGDGIIGNATLIGSLGTNANCVRCSAPCQNYCCRVPPTRYCHYNGKCWCVS